MSGELTIRQARDARSRRAFLRLPFDLYRGNSNWVPPLRSAQKRLFACRTAFFSRAQMALFLARRDGKTVGRIAAIHNRAHNEHRGDKVGFFGFFECDRSDTQAAHALLDRAADWLAGRGLEVIRGPVNPCMNAECGLLVDGFDRPPMVMMPYNPPAYERLLTEWGLSKCKDLYAYLIEADNLRPGTPGHQRLRRVAAAARRRHPEISVRALDMRHFERDVLEFLAVFEQARSDNWGHVPLTEDEITETARAMKPILDPQIALLAEVDGKPAGASLGIPNVNRALAAINGRLWPLGFLRFAREMRRISEIRALGIGALPEYRHLGITAILLLETILRGTARGIRTAEASWILEDNAMSNRTIGKNLQPRRYKTYRIYEGSTHSANRT